MSETEKNLPPRIYHQSDPDGILTLWKDLVDTVTEGFRDEISNYQEITDPDTAPIEFVELILWQLGSPFRSYPLTDNQKRKLAKLLIPMYNQKGLGKEKGIVTAARFLLGLEVEIIDPHAYPEDGWHVGASEIGLSTYSGGRRVYCNILNWTEDFAESDWITSLATVTSDATTGPSPWGRDADQIDLSSPGAQLYQDVTPLSMNFQDFTGSIWIKGSASGTLKAILQSIDDPLDSTETELSITTDWTRFIFQHTTFPGASGDLRFLIQSDAGFVGNLYFWGASLVRDDNIDTPYAQRTDNGEDCDRPGAWAFHFFIQTPEEIDDDQESLLREIADFMKPAHTHYDIIEPDDPGFIDHWEVGVSELGINTYVHS